MICLHSTSHVLIAKALSLCFKKCPFFLSLPRNLVGRWHFGLQYLYCRMLSFWFWHRDEMKPFLWNETLFPCHRYHISATCLFQEASCLLQTSSLCPSKTSPVLLNFNLCSLKLCISSVLTITWSALLMMRILHICSFSSFQLYSVSYLVGLFFLLISHFFISFQKGLHFHHFK